MLECIHTHAWLNLWDKHMTTGRINQVFMSQHSMKSVNVHVVQQHIAVSHPFRLLDGSKFWTQAFCMLTSIHIHTSKSRTECSVNLQHVISMFNHFDYSDRISTFQAALNRSVTHIPWHMFWARFVLRVDARFNDSKYMIVTAPESK